MYIIKEKNRYTALFSADIQPAPAADHNPRHYFPAYDPTTMEWGWQESPELPPFFRIEPGHRIVPLTLLEQVSEKLIELRPEEKIVDNQIVVKSLLEQQADGLLLLNKEYKIVDNDIVEKTLEEMLAEGSLTLAPDEKIENGEIMLKSLSEQVRDGVVVLAPDERLEGEEIVFLSVAEQVAQGLIVLDPVWEYLDGGQIKVRTVNEALEGGHLHSRLACEAALQRIYDQIEDSIRERYPSGYESKLTKAYLRWMQEGQPPNDERNRKFEQMEADISSLKATFRGLKDRLKGMMASYS
ncbi:MAG: hypothetical protein AAGN35_14640 [Bacteroidota bacterium]